MLSWLSELKDISIFFNLFNYVSFRTGGAVLTAFIMSLYMGPRMIAWLRSLQGAGQPIRDDAPETHLKKVGTPTMGGLMILFGAVVSILLWANPKSPFVWIVLMVTLGFGATRSKPSVPPAA